MIDKCVGIAAQFAAEPNGELSKGDRHNSSDYLTTGEGRAPIAHFGCDFGAGAGEDVLLPAGAWDCSAVNIAGVMSSVGVE